MGKNKEEENDLIHSSYTNLSRSDDRWKGAVQVLAEELPIEVIRKVYDMMQKDPKGWWSKYHFDFGISVRNLLRKKGYTDELFGCNLDDIYIPLVKDAVKSVMLGK